MVRNARLGALLAATVALLVFSGPARAVSVTDGSLVLNIANDGQFNAISLNGVGIDTSPLVQQYFLMGGATFWGGSPVNVVGPTATYSANVGLFNVSVASTILGPLASAPGVTNVLEQVLTFTNPTANPVTLANTSFMDQDLKTTGGGDTVRYDAAHQAVVAVDAPQLMAAIAATGVPGATFGWDVGVLGTCNSYWPLSGTVGPVGPTDTAMAIGYNVGQVAPGGSASMTFRYLFSTDLAAAPDDFSFEPPPIPEPVTLLGLAGGLVGLVGYVRRRRAA